MIFVKSLQVLCFIGYCCAAPNPVNWDEVGRKINDFGKKIVPVAQGACGFINNLPADNTPKYPSFQFNNNPFARGFPSAQNYPAYSPPAAINPTYYYPQQYYPPYQVPNTRVFYTSRIPATSTIPPLETQTALEQNDLNSDVNGIPPIPPTNDLNEIPSFIPPTKDQNNPNNAVTDNSELKNEPTYLSFGNRNWN